MNTLFVRKNTAEKSARVYLIAEDEQSADALSAIKDGSTLKVSVKKARSPRQHRLLFLCSVRSIRRRLGHTHSSNPEMISGKPHWSSLTSQSANSAFQAK